LAEFAYRFTGSSDLYQTNGRRPHASINFVTAHDGFTLRDLVSYNEKHNQANGEEGRDGDSHNRSWNCGAEGETNKPEIVQLRQQQQRNFLVTLMLSQGVPMLLAGDEMGRSQQGNNNPYCQDNEVSWVNWDLQDHALLQFSQKLINFRSQHPSFRRRKWFQGRAIHGSDVRDIVWFNPNGGEMTEKQWNDGLAKAIAIFLNGQEIRTPGSRGERIVDNDFLIIFNAHYEAIEFTLPKMLQEWEWVTVVDTTMPQFVEQGYRYKKGEPLVMTERTSVVLQKI
jgi:glycogen operon protein